MSPDTDKKKKAARRAGLALATVGAIAAGPLAIAGAQTTTTPATPATPGSGTAAAVASVGGLGPGEKLPTEKKMPPALTKALATKTPVVVAFVLPGITEDNIVRSRLRDLRKDRKFSDTKILVYNVTPESKLFDLPEALNMTSTPLVAVFQSDGKLSNTWRGLVDKEIIAQSVVDARASVPRAIKVTVPKGGPLGDKAGIALARKVNARYTKVPAVTYTEKYDSKRPANFITGMQTFDTQEVLQNGKTAKLYAKGVDYDKVPVEVVVNRTGVFLKRQTMACWTYSKPDDLGQILQQPAIPVANVKFGKPVKAKKDPNILIMKATPKGGGKNSSVYIRINKKTLDIVKITGVGMTLTITNGDAEAAPATPAAQAAPATPAAPASPGTSTAPADPAAPATPATPAAGKPAPANPASTWPKPAAPFC